MGRMTLRRGLKPVPPFNRTERHIEHTRQWDEAYWRQRYTWSVDEQDFPAFTIFDQGYILDAMVEPRTPSRVIIPVSVVKAIRTALVYAVGPGVIQQRLRGAGINMDLLQVEQLCNQIRLRRNNSMIVYDPSLSS